MAITFNTLNPDAKIFQELKKNPYWWTRFKKDSSLYPKSVIRISLCRTAKRNPLIFPI